MDIRFAKMSDVTNKDFFPELDLSEVSWTDKIAFNMSNAFNYNDKYHLEIISGSDSENSNFYQELLEATKLKYKENDNNILESYDVELFVRVRATKPIACLPFNKNNFEQAMEITRHSGAAIGARLVPKTKFDKIYVIDWKEALEWVAPKKNTSTRSAPILDTYKPQEKVPHKIKSLEESEKEKQEEISRILKHGKENHKLGTAEIEARKKYGNDRVNKNKNNNTKKSNR